MDCKDLMIGDWVYNKHHKKNIQITPYDFFNHGHNEFGKQFLPTNPKLISGNDFDPIPITEDILVKNGFRYTANVIGRHNCKCYELEQKGVYHMTISIYKNTITCELDKVDALYMNVVTNYVHELQHLLRLCGIEKKLTIN